MHQRGVSPVSTAQWSTATVEGTESFSNLATRVRRFEETAREGTLVARLLRLSLPSSIVIPGHFRHTLHEVWPSTGAETAAHNAKNRTFEAIAEHYALLSRRLCWAKPRVVCVESARVCQCFIGNAPCTIVAENSPGVAAGQIWASDEMAQVDQVLRATLTAIGCSRTSEDAKLFSLQNSVFWTEMTSGRMCRSCRNLDAALVCLVNLSIWRAGRMIQYWDEKKGGEPSV